MPETLNPSPTLSHVLACFRQAHQYTLLAAMRVNQIKVELEEAEYAARQAEMAYSAARNALLKAAEEDSPSP